MREYAIIVTSDEARSTTTPERPLTKRGEKFWVVKEPDGWVPATSTRYGKRVPNDLLTFASADEAHAFAKGWKGHPWYCLPIEHVVVEVRERYVQVPDGYELV